LSAPRKRVLVAEGDQIILVLLSHILTRQGYLVDTVATADEAEARLMGDHYDAVLLDADMPGWRMEWLREVADGRVIILSGKTLETDLPVGVVIRKPIEFASLLETVANCLTKTH